MGGLDGIKGFANFGVCMGRLFAMGRVCYVPSSPEPSRYQSRNGEGIKPGTNPRNPVPKPGTKFCQQNIAIEHACIELKFGSNVDYSLFFEMHISIFLHLPYFYHMQMKYRTMSWNTDPGPTFSVLTMSRNS